MPVKAVRNILKVLAYFDIFHYPLTKQEIHLFLGQAMHADELLIWLQHLVEQQQLFQFGDCYSLHNDASLYERRRAGNAKACSMLPVAHRIGSFLYQFPFVRGIGISGSLSKNVADQDSDIDFFIITSANHLWIARTCMHLFKKLTFLTGKQHWYCMNYYIDEASLRIEEQNIFTATELITLVPVSGQDALKQFFLNNDWTAGYFPNTTVVKNAGPDVKPTWFKKAMEWLLNNRAGDALDTYLMRLTSRRWKQKEQENRVNAHGHRMGLRNGKHVSKPNPVYFQQKILEAYEERVTLVEARINLLHRMIV